jgi:hypothetical protein
VTDLSHFLILPGVLLLLAGAAAAPAWAAGRWRRATGLAVARLAGGAAPAAAAEAESPAGLPEPVVRYFAFALEPRSLRPIRAARVEQAGSFAFRPGVWKPFTAVQHYRVKPPGFVWDARIAFARLLPVRVRDAYAGGRGQMRARLLGLVPMADLEGGGQLAAASLQRHLAELPWLPTALLPAAGVTWSPIDGRRARATLQDGEISATVDFHFGDQGQIERVTSLRSRAVGETMVPTPWEGRFWDYREVEGLRLPHQAEVAWLLPEGRHAYWRASIVRFELDRG